MRFALLAAGFGLLMAAPLHAQPFIIPLSPQPERQPPPPPPPSPVPIAPAQEMAGQRQGRPTIVFNGTDDQRLGAASGRTQGTASGTRGTVSRGP